ncbi:MAG: ATP-binding cassette domain-containing protein, partial [Nitrospira sp.]|nr:ATP-binding cassette domain-containing protein [Nitrospira sp.]
MIEIKDLSLRISDFSLNDVSLTIQDREYLVILGPTGAGKTVFMECLAGLHKIKRGEVWIDNTNITHLAPEERNIGYVPQDYVLFPFLNVQDNILFGLKLGKHSKKTIQKQLLTLTDLLGINHLLNRDTRTLSGGEKQRVALARALATSPRILLMDEPFSSLDVQTSKYLRLELRRIHQGLGVTTIHITHNQIEAEEMADRIAVMISGRIAQVGKPHDIFFYPESEIVSHFVGSVNILNCNSCRQLVPGLMEVDCNGINVVLPHDAGNIEKIAISPRDVYISDVLPPGPSVNRYKGLVTAIDFNSTMATVSVNVGNIGLKAEMPSELAREMNLFP